MFISEFKIEGMAALYGRPVVRRFRIESTLAELDKIRKSQRDGRNHDVTVYVRKGGLYAVISKHVYPPGLFRAMSGGVHRDEAIEDGLRREVREELGCDIKIVRFLMRTEVDFVSEDDIIHWRSLVFLADWVKGDFAFTDTREIREVALVPLSKFREFREKMLGRSSGLRYRAELHDAVEPLLFEHG